MAMDPAGLKAKMQATIYNGLKAEFGSEVAVAQGYTPIADAAWQKMADAISGIAMDIVTEITTNAIVDIGIPTVGGPAAQITVAPGKIS